MKNLLKNKKIVSLLTNFMFFIITYIVAGYWFNTLDDFIYSQISEHHYLTVNSFQWISHINYFLNKIFPSINGWGLFLVVITFISSYKLYHIFLTKEQSKNSKIILSIAYFTTIFWLLFQLQYTIIATFVIVTGIFSIEHYLKNKKKEDIILGLILFIIGISIRKESLMFVVPLCAIILFDNIKNKDFLKRFVATMCALSIIMFGATIVDIKTYNDEYYDFYVYNKTRVGISDSRLDHLVIDKDMENITINKYNMLDRWLFSDYETFSTKDLQELTPILDEIIEEQKEEMFFQQFIITMMHNIFSHHLWLLLLLLIFFRTDNTTTILILLSIIGFIFIFTFMNRSTYRVAFSAHLPLTLYLIMHCTKMRFKIKYLIPILIIPFIMNYLHFISFETVGASRTFSPDFYQEFINNKSNSYYVSSDVYTTVETRIPVLDKSAKETYMNSYLGFWTVTHPYEKDINEKMGIENPIKDLIYKDNHYLIQSSKEVISDILQKYFVEEYGIKTTIETVKTGKDYIVTKFNKVN